MKLRALAFLVAMAMSVAAFAVPDIKAGAHTGSCCIANGVEGTSQSIKHGDGITEWSCVADKKTFNVAFNSGLFPYIDFVDELQGPIGTWSAWFNEDRPSGKGDFELLKPLVDGKRVCAAPLVIQCQTVKGGIDWSKAGLVYHCDLSKGGYCVNQEQAAGKSCQDFQVRYLCSNLVASAAPVRPSRNSTRRQLRPPSRER
jgi:hypothetical protein